MTLRVRFIDKDGNPRIIDYGCDVTQIKKIINVEMLYDYEKSKQVFTPKRLLNKWPRMFT